MSPVGSTSQATAGGAPPVSFVIPTRNHAAFLRRAIDSCLAQGIEGAEVLVVDGASTDGTREILESYGTRIRWLSEPDRGQSDAVNKGIAMASGEIIAWLNSDDYYADEAVVRRVLAAFSAEPTLDIAYGHGQMVDVQGRPIRPYRARPIATPRDILVHPASPLLQPAAFFRRRVFLEAGGLDLSLHFAMDYELWIRLFSRARLARFIDQTLACATYHADAKSVRGMARQIRETIAVKRRYAGPLGLSAREHARMALGVVSLLAYWAAVRTRIRRAM